MLASTVIVPSVHSNLCGKPPIELQRDYMLLSSDHVWLTEPQLTG